jgi:hypothetical protein
MGPCDNMGHDSEQNGSPVRLLSAQHHVLQSPLWQLIGVRAGAGRVARNWNRFPGRATRAVSAAGQVNCQQCPRQPCGFQLKQLGRRMSLKEDGAGFVECIWPSEGGIGKDAGAQGVFGCGRPLAPSAELWGNATASVRGSQGLMAFYGHVPRADMQSSPWVSLGWDGGQQGQWPQ